MWPNDLNVRREARLTSDTAGKGSEFRESDLGEEPRSVDRWRKSAKLGMSDQRVGRVPAKNDHDPQSAARPTRSYLSQTVRREADNCMQNRRIP